MPRLRGYQWWAEHDIYRAWARGSLNVLLEMPTGAGKTVVFSDILNHHDDPSSLTKTHPDLAYQIAHIFRVNGDPSCAIAHRKELVGQISVALAVNNVPHRIIAQRDTIRQIINEQVQETGRSLHHPNAKVAVAAVDTLNKKVDELKAWRESVGLWVIDEAHHVLESNKWGKAVSLFPNARGLGVTATPVRADGHGLGRNASGVFDELVQGPDMRQLINEGWLVDYRIFCPQSDVDTSQVALSKDGDYNPQQLKKAIRQSRIVGDVVENYMRIAPGKQGVVFASDVETATDIATRFNERGVWAECISGKTKTSVRNNLIRQYRRGEITILVNVDLFGEGFDVPAMEVAVFARPTESYAVYAQQFGRALRPMIAGQFNTPEQRRAAIAASKKPNAIIIDHVGNVIRHGLPDAPREWTLNGREKRAKKEGDEIPLTACDECLGVYERVLTACPYCGHKPVPADRSGPEQVDGDLTELDPAILAQLRGEKERVDMTPADYRTEQQRKGAPKIGEHANVRRHQATQDAQAALRASMAWWAAYYRDQGRPDAEIYRRFWHRFGVDALTAQTLGRADALALADRINADLAARQTGA